MKSRPPCVRALVSVMLIVVCAIYFPPHLVFAQSDQSTAPSGGAMIETTPLPASAVGKITEIPLPVDMNLAKQFVKLGFGPMVLGQTGFQSTEFLTPVLSTRQAAELVLLVPDYGPFKGPAVAKGIRSFAGRVSGVAFGRELSPVLYVHLPYWTHQREGPIQKGTGRKCVSERH